jgi:hypothetical protein
VLQVIPSFQLFQQYFICISGLSLRATWTKTIHLLCLITLITFVEDKDYRTCNKHNQLDTHYTVFPHPETSPHLQPHTTVTNPAFV